MRQACRLNPGQRIKEALMRRVMGLACMFTAAMAVSFAAQAPKAITDEDYSKGMKEISQLNNALRKNLAGGSPETSAQDASRLEVLFKDVLGYWEAKKYEDAIAGSKTAVMAASNLSKALAAKDMAAATEAQKTLGGTCTPCHNVYREQLPDKTYRFKPVPK